MWRDLSFPHWPISSRRERQHSAQRLVLRGVCRWFFLFFHDVDHLGVFKRRVEEERTEPLLHDVYFQLGHLLDVRGLL